MGERVDSATLRRAIETRQRMEEDFAQRLADQDEAIRALTVVLVLADHPEAQEPVLGGHACPDPGVKRSKRAKGYVFPPGKLLDPNKPSPTGCCVYDDDADPCHDFCLYCGDPEERK